MSRPRVAGRYPGCYVRITVSGDSSDHTLASNADLHTGGAAFRWPWRHPWFEYFAPFVWDAGCGERRFREAVLASFFCKAASLPGSNANNLDKVSADQLRTGSAKKVKVFSRRDFKTDSSDAQLNAVKAASYKKRFEQDQNMNRRRASASTATAGEKRHSKAKPTAYYMPPEP